MLFRSYALRNLPEFPPESEFQLPENRPDREAVRLVLPDRVIGAGAVLRDPLGRETIGNSTDDRQAVFNRGRRRHAIPDQSDRRLRRFETAVRKITDLDFPGAMANEPADVFSGAP